MLGVDILIFVILGTQDKAFTSLLEAIDTLDLKQEIIVQAGSTKYESNKMKIFDYLEMPDFNKYIEKSDFVITHGGVGSILDSLKHNKKVIAVPRLSEYDEHENNHQLQIVNEFEKLGYILACLDLNELENKIKQINKFKPQKYKSNNTNFIKLLENYIDSIGDK